MLLFDNQLSHARSIGSRCSHVFFQWSSLSLFWDLAVVGNKALGGYVRFRHRTNVVAPNTASSAWYVALVAGVLPDSPLLMVDLVAPPSIVFRASLPKQRSRRCQREHWVIHKLCCGKSYNQVCAGKKALEESIVAAAASSSDATKA